MILTLHRIRSTYVKSTCYFVGVYPVDGEGLVERLEEISLLQEEGKEGQQEPDNDR